MQREKLKNISSIRFGLNAKTNDRSGVLCLQGKDIKDQRIEFGGAVFVDSKYCSDNDYLQPGNVLFSAKGNRHNATVWDKKEKKAVASSSFLILSVNDHKILPEYLAWYLNHPKIQNYLNQIKKGSTISVVSKKEFADIDVEILPIEIQEKIIRINKLETREQELMDELKKKRKLLVQEIMNKIFQK